MNPMSKNRVKPVYESLLISSLFLFMSLSAHATPPTPPVQLLLPKVEALAVLQPEKGAFTVSARVRAHQEVQKLTLIVRTTKMGILGRREGWTKEYTLKGLEKGETKPVEIKISIHEKDGLYRVEASLQVEQKGKRGVVSKGVLMQVVEKGKQRLTTPVELRRTHISRKKQAFKEALAKKPKQPDIRLLMDRTVQVPKKLKKHIDLIPAQNKNELRDQVSQPSLNPTFLIKPNVRNRKIVMYCRSRVSTPSHFLLLRTSRSAAKSSLRIGTQIFPGILF